MELVDMRGLKPRPYWVLVRPQVRVFIIADLRFILLQSNLGVLWRLVHFPRFVYYSSLTISLILSLESYPDISLVTTKFFELALQNGAHLFFFYLICSAIWRLRCWLTFR